MRVRIAYPAFYNSKGRRGGARHKEMNKIVSMVERGGGVRSMHVADVTGHNIKTVLTANIAKESYVMTDSSPRYNFMKREMPFEKYDQVNHSKGEYVRGDVTKRWKKDKPAS